MGNLLYEESIPSFLSGLLVVEIFVPCRRVDTCDPSRRQIIVYEIIVNIVISIRVGAVTVPPGISLKFGFPLVHGAHFIRRTFDGLVPTSWIRIVPVSSTYTFDEIHTKTMAQCLCSNNHLDSPARYPRFFVGVINITTIRIDNGKPTFRQVLIIHRSRFCIVFCPILIRIKLLRR